MFQDKSILEIIQDPEGKFQNTTDFPYLISLCFKKAFMVLFIYILYSSLF